MNDRLEDRARMMIRSFKNFVSAGSGVDLFDYQLDPADSILNSIQQQLGLTIVIIFPRMSGKDELLAHLVSYLMRMLNDKDHSIIEINSSEVMHDIAFSRLVEKVSTNVLTRARWLKYKEVVGIGTCLTTFLYPGQDAGYPILPADLLFIVNDAQNILPDYFDEEYFNLAFTNNITRVICGSSWDDKSLLSREAKKALVSEKTDGIKRVFKVSADEVAKVKQGYGEMVAEVSEMMGKNNQYVLSQYYGKEIITGD
ncbi:hypothetical protein ACFLTX_00100 [Chloroflexota bacterium]